MESDGELMHVVQDRGLKANILEENAPTASGLRRVIVQQTFFGGNHMFKSIFSFNTVAIGAMMMMSLVSVRAFADDKPDKATGGSLSHGDMKFVDEAAQGGMTEVKASQMAVDKAVAPSIKSFAQKMIDDHSKANSELQSLALSKGVTVPSELDSHHQKMIDKLAGLSADDFDKAYVEDMVKDHKDTVDMFEKFAERGDDHDLKTWAAKTLPTLQMHYSMIQEIQNKMNLK
ncbi:MAG TPA: DUF4142 domain-containing protein [Tepidisphaeraceae bacterium]|nr:DUF4142 domain-containing protein [Tepidisphaeraceae bacterium]